MQEELRNRCAKYARHFSGLSGVSCFIFDAVKKSVVYSCPEKIFCSFCGESRCNQVNTHLYGCSEAYRWNGKYIYYCPLGLVFAASSISQENGQMIGGMISGPLMMGSLEDTLEEIPYPSTRNQAAHLPLLDTVQVNHLAEILTATAAFASGVVQSYAGAFLYEQEKLLNAIYDKKAQLNENPNQPGYPRDLEKKLYDLILTQDKSAAQNLLNELLANIYLSCNFDLEIIKVRVLELIVLLSRATIDSGADINEIFTFNSNYIRDVEQFGSIEELTVWLTGILERFFSYSFDFIQIKHSNVVYRVMDYIKENCAKKISLDDIAKHVYLSRSYLSSIFKEETGENISAYITRARVEKSKILLLEGAMSLVDIASACGFEDQSYFTKVFKKLTGVSPKKYRDTGGRMGG